MVLHSRDLQAVANAEENPASRVRKSSYSPDVKDKRRYSTSIDKLRRRFSTASKSVTSNAPDQEDLASGKLLQLRIATCMERGGELLPVHCTLSCLMSCVPSLAESVLQRVMCAVISRVCSSESDVHHH